MYSKTLSLALLGWAGFMEKWLTELQKQNKKMCLSNVELLNSNILDEEVTISLLKNVVVGGNTGKAGTIRALLTRFQEEKPNFFLLLNGRAIKAPPPPPN